MNANKEQKNNGIINEAKGRGLFYGVIAIATFIIMAVGATFAYFTATTNSMNAAVQTGSTTLQLKYISYGSAWLKRDLIPADTTVVEYSVENQSDITTSTPANPEGVYKVNGNNTLCVDDFGNSICSVYVFQVTNSSNSPQNVSLEVISEKNGFASLNAMAYEISVADDDLEDYSKVEGANGVNDPVFRQNSEDNAEGKIDVTDGYGALLESGEYTPIYINRDGVTKTLLSYTYSKDVAAGTMVKKPAIDRKLVSLPTPDDEYKEATERTAQIADDIEIRGGVTKTFAIVLYIKNEDVDQTGTDAEKIFTGQVVVSSGDGSGGVSGSISAMGKTEEDNLQSNTQGSGSGGTGTDEEQQDPLEPTP